MVDLKVKHKSKKATLLIVEIGNISERSSDTDNQYRDAL